MRALPSHNNLALHFPFSLSIVMLLGHLHKLYKEFARSLAFLNISNQWLSTKWSKLVGSSSALYITFEYRDS